MIEEAIVEVVLGLEAAVWQALVDGDQGADESLLADDFVGLYSSGFASRQDHVEQLADGPSMTEYSLGSPNVAEIAEGHVRLSYEATYRRTSNGIIERMYVTSLWSFRDGRWLNTFSQDTPAVSEPNTTD